MTFYTSLTENHGKMLFDESGIAPEIAAERGYETVTKRADLLDFGKKQRRASADAPALRVPLYSPDGITRLSQIRPHTPRVAGLKYETPAGAELIIDVHPRMRDRVRHGDEPVLVTEGAKTGDAATSRDIPTVVVAGVWGWCVPDVKPYRLRPCWDHVRLRGRPVYICYDSDCMTKEPVQKALAALVEALEERGAVVKVIYLPDAPDGSKQGIDDYLVAGGTIKEMFMLARTFEAADIGRIRVSRDDNLRAAVEYLWRRWREGDWMRFVGRADKGNWARGHTARDVMEALIELAAARGKPDGEGVVARVGLRRLSELAAKSVPSSRKALAHLEADGQIEIIASEDRSKPRSYRLLVPRADLSHNEGKGGPEREDTRSEETSPIGVKPLRAPTAPRLRWSSPGRPRRREFEVVPGRCVVRHSGRVPRNPTVEELEAPPYTKRLGPHKGAALDVLEAAGGEMRIEGLCEALHRKRPRDVRRRILKPLEEAGIIEGEGEVIRLTGEWLARLEEERERKGEIEQAERQARKHCEQSVRYRKHLERERHGTPKASLDAVRRTRELRERRLREIRDEEERDRAPTPPAVEVLVAKILSQHGRMRMGLLCDVAREKGLRWRDVPPAVRRMGYRVERLPEHGDAEFVYHDKPSSPKKEKEVRPIPETAWELLGTAGSRQELPEPPREKWRDHALSCECDACLIPSPRYAQLGGAA